MVNPSIFVNKLSEMMNRYFAIFNVKETWRGNSKLHSIKDGQSSIAGGD